MDDTLYYVESPDGQVLGPMNMIHILEGIAAGVILESARVCEVGTSDWIPLSELATTRPDDAAPQEEPAISLEHERVADDERPYGAPEPVETGSPERDDLGLLGNEVAAAGGFEEFPLVEERLAREEPVSSEHPFAREEPVPSEHPLAREEPVPSAEPVASEKVAGKASDPEVSPQAAFRNATAATDASVEMAFGSEGARDFALDMKTEEAPDEEWTDEDEAEVKERERPRWLVPAIAVLAVPIIAGVFFLTKGREGETRRATETAQLAPPVSPMREAADLLAAGRARDAMGRYQQILLGEPDNAEAHHGLGESALVAGEAETAVTHLERACELEPGRNSWVADLAQALYDVGRTESAIQKVSAYLAANPGDRKRQLARLDWMLAAGKEAEVAKTYSELADERPEDAYFLYLAGVALGENPAAVDYLRESVEIDPANGDAQAAYGRALALHGRTQPAIQALRKAFELRPARPEETALLASLEKPAPPPKAEPARAPGSEPSPEPGKPAPKVAAPASARTPADLASRAQQVREALALERFDRAEELLAQARRELGSSPEARAGLELWEGIVAFEEGRFDEALDKFAALRPETSYRSAGANPAVAANWIARVHLAKGETRQAVAALDAVGPSDLDEWALARLWEGVALSALGMDDLALRTWERIPIDAGGRVGKAGRAAVESAQLLTGAMSPADYTVSVESTPGWSNDAEFFLALAAQRARDAEGAHRHFARVLELSAGREFPYHLARAEMDGSGTLIR